MTVNTISIAKGKKCQLQTETLPPAKQSAVLTTRSSAMVGQSYSRNVSKQHTVVLFEVIQRNSNRLSQFMKTRNAGSSKHRLHLADSPLASAEELKYLCIERVLSLTYSCRGPLLEDTFLTDSARVPDAPLRGASHTVRHKSTEVPDPMEFGQW